MAFQGLKVRQERGNVLAGASMEEGADNDNNVAVGSLGKRQVNTDNDNNVAVGSLGKRQINTVKLPLSRQPSYNRQGFI